MLVITKKVIFFMSLFHLFDATKVSSIIGDFFAKKLNFVCSKAQKKYF